jgi:hypothetical protein
MLKDTKFWRELYFELCTEVEQVLGKALGYPWYKNDQKNFPGATENEGVCTGEDTPESLLYGAAARIGLLEALANSEANKKPLMFGGNATTPRTATGANLSISDDLNTPCTAALEVKLQKLAKYFKKRAKENTKRAEKEEKNIKGTLESGYYFSGKADAYARAAKKITDVLGVEYGGDSYSVVFLDEAKDIFTPASPNLWCIKTKLKGEWVQSKILVGTYGSKEEAELAIRTSTLDPILFNYYLAAPLMGKVEPEEWIVERQGTGSKDWLRSINPETRSVYLSKDNAKIAVERGEHAHPNSLLSYRARRVK